VLTDAVMPQMGGPDLVRALRSDYPEFPVVMVSALEKEEDLIRGLDAGAQDYIIKPFNNRIVMARVRSAARSKAAYDLIAEMNIRLEHGLERIAALFQIVDGAQVVGAGMLRGVHDTRVPMIFALFGYWAIGLGVGVALAFAMRWRGIGIWTGLAAGLGVVAVLMMWRWTRREPLGLTRF